ncbi:MAG TPA: 4Fe-4S dicluster domain-containing protein [Candidatus Woesearchaeota archaeon]|nr:4Fe-4S dicluster domain-containing protein [Candidatus Woesearchaeota archaeon]
MKIAITGGKGGTGKSTVATALAVELSKKNKVLLIDADADCPNDHLILSIKRKKVKDVFQLIPKWDFKKCIKCGKCGLVCKQHAIVSIKDKYPIFIPEQCNGCKACMFVCPTNAIGKDNKKIGSIYYGKKQNISFVSGELEPNQPSSEIVISAVNDYVSKIKENYDFIIVDTAAGTHCDVISALDGCELAIAVTEPTPLGEHDLELILKLLRILKIPYNIVLNKADVGDKTLIEKTANKFKTRIIAEIPYKKSILKAYSKGEPIKDGNINRIIKFLKNGKRS